MSRRVAPWAALLAAFALIGSCGREPTGLATRHGGLVLEPRFANAMASAILDLGVVRVVLTRPVTEAVVLDTVVPFPATADSLQIVLQVPIEAPSETFTLRMAITNAAGDTVFRVGPAPVLATDNPLLPPSEIPDPVYVGVGADAAGVRFVDPPAFAYFSQVVPIAAEAFDGGGAAIPGTPIGFELVTPADSTRARFLDRGVGALTTFTTRGDVQVRAYLLSGQTASHTLAIQPVANGIQVVSGNGQTPTVGSATAQPLVARVVAADAQGVAGIPVDFRLTRGADTLAVVRDTSDATGQVSFTPTVGTVAGAHEVSATVVGIDGAVANFGVTALAGAATRLEFTGQPSDVLPLAPITPAVALSARDAFGNLASSFTGDVTVAMLDNPQGAVLGGTTTRAAVGGVATFNDLTLSGAGTGLTLLASAGGVASDTSATFAILLGTPVRLEITQEPTDRNATEVFTPAITVALKDAGGNTVTGATDVVGIEILANPSGAVLAGPTSVAAVDGIATFAGLSIAKAGAGYTLRVTSGAMTSDTSAAFTVAVGPATQLAFLTQPPATLTINAQMNVQVGAYDAGLNLTAFGGAVTITIANNPGGATLGGTTSVNAELGIASYGDLTLDQFGTGYTLQATASGLVAATSNAFDVTPPPNAVVWMNPAGGDWNTPSNWSTGAVPTASDTAIIALSGNYAVQIASNAILGRVQVGAASGTQSLVLIGGSVQLADTVFMGAGTSFGINGAQLSGAGTVVVGDDMSWNSGNISGGGGTIVTLPGSYLSIGSGASRTLNDFTIEVGGAGGWDGAAAIGSGSGAVFRVLPGATFDLMGSGGYFYDQGGTQSVFEVLGTVNRTVATDTIRVPALSGTGVVNVQTGILETRNGGTFTGTINVSAGAEMLFSWSGVHLLGAGGSVQGAGNVTVTGGTLDVQGNWNLTGDTRLFAGTIDWGVVGGTTNGFTMTGGSKGGTGLMQVSGTMTWTAGHLSGGSGATRVLAGGSLVIDGAAARSLNDHALEIAGSGVWTGSRAIGSGSGGRIRVLAGGTLDLQGGGGIFYDQGGAQSTFEVLGTVTRTVGTDTIRVPGLSVGSTGVVTVSSGILESRNNGTSDGTLIAELGAELLFTSGTQTLTASSTVNGGGVISAGPGSTVTSAGSWAVTGTTRVNGGTLDYDGSGSTTGFELLSGIKGGSGSLLINGPFTWTGGSVSGGFGETVVAATGFGAISGAAARTLNSHILAIAGTVTWTGTHSVSSGSGGVIRVDAGGSLDIQGDPSWIYDQGGAQSFFEVSGTVTRTVSANVALVPGLSVAGGTVVVGSGILEARNNGTSSGTLTAADGGELRFTSGTQTMTGTALVDGAGIVRVESGATVTTLGGWAVTGTTIIGGTGVLDFDGPGGTTATFEMLGGTKGGSGIFEVSSVMNWIAGSLNGGGGVTRVLAGAAIGINGPGNARTINSHVLEIAGSGNWLGTFNLSSGSGGGIRILPGGALDIQGDPVWTYDQGGAQSFFEVQGALTRTTSSGTVVVPGLSVSGTVLVASGVLEARNVGTSSGTFTATAPGTLRFGSGSHTLDASSDVNGSGTVSFIAGATTSAAGAWNVTGTTLVAGGSFLYDGASGSTAALDVQSGVKGGDGILSVTGAMTWSGGSLQNGTGTTRVEPGATLAVSGGTGRTLSEHTLELLGTGTWGGSHSVSSGSGARVRVGASGQLTINNDPQFLYNQGGGPVTFENLGSLQVNGPGTTVISMVFADAGSLSVGGGATLNLSGGGTLGGTSMVVESAGILQFVGGTYVMQPTLDQTGAGTVVLGNATLNGLTTGDTARFSNFQASSGSLNPAAGGVVQVANLIWSGTTSFGGGGETLIPLGAAAALSGTGGRSLSDHHLVVAGTAVWTGDFTLNSGSNARIRVLPSGQLIVQPPSGTTASFLSNLGGGTAILEVQGSLLINSDATFTVSAQLQHAAGATSAHTLGTWNVNGGGTIAGDLFTDGPATMVFGGGTTTLADDLIQTGLGQVVLAAGTLTTALAADTAEVGRLRLDGGTVDPNGTIVVSDHLEWAGNTSISGGRLVAADTAILSGTLGRTLNAATLELQGVTRWLSDFEISSGSVARLLNTASGDFEWGDGDYDSNQGGGQSILENHGALRFVGTGTAQITAFVSDTTSNALVIANGGTVDIASGGRLGGAIANNSGVLQFGGGTMSLKGGASFGGPGVVRVTTSTVRADTADLGVISIANLELQGGVMDHEGEVQVTASMSWTGGGLNSNTVGTPGTTRIMSGALATISGVNGKSLAAHRFAVDDGGSVTYTGSGAFNTGSLARIVNAGVWDFNGPASITNALGGGTSVFENTGTGIVYTTAATTGIMDLPIDNLGQLVVLGDTLRLDGGSTGNFASLATVNTAAIRLGGGIFTMTGVVSVGGSSGALTIGSGGTLVVGANTLSVGGDLRTEVNGVLNSSDPSSNVNVAGDAIFTGGASVLTAGVLNLTGDFTQGGGNGSTFSASGSHATVLNGTGRQTVSFLHPGAGVGAGRFSQLNLGTAPSPRRVELLSAVFAAQLRDELVSQADSIISSSSALLTASNANATNTVFAGVRLSLTGATGGHVLDQIRFDLMDPTVTQFAIDLNAGVSQVFTNATFATTPTTGFYVAIRQMTEGAAAAISLPIPVSPPSPGGFYDRLRNGGVTTFPNVIWADVTNP